MPRSFRACQPRAGLCDGLDNSVSGGIIGASTLLLVNYLVVRFLFRHANLERVVEGDETVLIEGGQVREDQLKKELLTPHDLEAAAHRQGFASLQDVQRATLEPGGTICFFAKKPLPEESRHRELLRRLDQMMLEIEKLRPRDAPPASA